MSMHSASIILIMLYFYTAFAYPQNASPSLGAAAQTSLINEWNTTVFADGTGLPEGAGTAAEGAPLYLQHCLGCHGPNGQGALAEELAGGEGTLTDRYPDKTIGLYWPYATTVFDVIRRSMPLHAPGSLSNNEVYALTAFLLSINGVIDAELEINAQTLPAVLMPNRNGFEFIDAQ